jgi:hypothetical protein
MSTLAWIFTDDTVYRWMAYGGTILFTGKLLLTFIGDALGGGDFDAGDAADAADVGDVDFDAADGVDIEHGSGAAFTVLSIQSFLAFFMAMGWMGLACLHEWDMGQTATLGIAGGFGFAVMMLNAVLMWQVHRLNSEGRYDLRTCVGHIGRVYLTIPEMGKGTGQVQVVASGQTRIVKASSAGPAIPSFTDIRVLELRDNQELVVQSEADYQAAEAAKAANEAQT